MFNNRKQHIPDVFKFIAENQAEQEKIKKNLVIEFERIRTLKKEMIDLRKGAEQLLHWNVDKGK